MDQDTQQTQDYVDEDFISAHQLLKRKRAPSCESEEDSNCSQDYSDEDIDSLLQGCFEERCKEFFSPNGTACQLFQTELRLWMAAQRVPLSEKPLAQPAKQRATLNTPSNYRVPNLPNRSELHKRVL